MSRFLRQKWSGHIFPWSARLAERDDMEPYEPPKPAPAPQPPPAPKKPAARPPAPLVAPPVAAQIPAQNEELAPHPLDDALKTFREEVQGALAAKGEA